MDDLLTGDALVLHAVNCSGCDDCRGRVVDTATARRIMNREGQPCRHGVEGGCPDDYDC